MFLNSLLEVSEQTTDLVQYIAIGAVALLAIIVLCVCLANRGKQFDTKVLAYAAVCLATSFVLSFIKVSPVMYGGSITLASWVPVLLYAYAFGAPRGFVVGIIFGVLNFISGPYILTPFTFVLDYILAFAMVGLMGFARKFTRSTLANVLIGTTIAVLARFVMHLFSGMIYFVEDAIWVDLPTPNAFVYSLIYQLVYVIPDGAICAIVFVLLAKTGTLDTLLHMLRPSVFPAAKAKTAAADASASAADANANGEIAAAQSYAAKEKEQQKK